MVLAIHLMLASTPAYASVRVLDAVTVGPSQWMLALTSQQHERLVVRPDGAIELQRLIEFE